MQDRIVTMIVWENGVEFDRIKRWLDKLKDAGHIDYVNTQDYNEENTSPILYFP